MIRLCSCLIAPISRVAMAGAPSDALDSSLGHDLSPEEALCVCDRLCARVFLGLFLVVDVCVRARVRAVLS